MIQIRALALSLGFWALAACGRGSTPTDLVVSADPELAAVAAALLPAVSSRAGLEALAPIRLERRSRAELTRYLIAKLDEEFPAREAESTAEAYALLGLAPPGLDLRGVLLALYAEQVAGFYEPDSTALFVLDDQPPEALEPLLVHELVHALQDQHVPLDSLTDEASGRDRAAAALAVIEGHATLVMLESMGSGPGGGGLDLTSVSALGERLRPALAGLESRFPALAGAPALVREGVLFPYLEGSEFVQRLWSEQGRVAPFGSALPISTEQVMTRDLEDEPLEFRIEVRGARVLLEDQLGGLGLGVFVREHAGEEGKALAEGWGGDRFVLVEDAARKGLVWYLAWDDRAARDRFMTELGGVLGRLGPNASLDALEVDAHPFVRLSLGDVEGVMTTVSWEPGR